MTEQPIDPESAAGLYGMETATLAARIINALQRADWINPDVENEDLSDACSIISREIADFRQTQNS